MMIMGYIVFLAAIHFFLVFLCYSFRNNNNGRPTKWPLVGVLPSLLQNHHRIHDYLVEIFEESKQTISFKGPVFTHIHMLTTVDPANVHHVLTKNFGNYHKGSKFTEIFDVFGESIISSDSHLWQYYRRLVQSLIGDPRFHQFFVAKLWEKVETGLVPVLDHVSKLGAEVDVQDLFGRFTFDVSCTMIMDYDPRSLSIDLPSIPSSMALDDVSDAILYRFVMPTCIWKLQRWLGVGKEKKYKIAWQTLDAFIYKCIASRKRKYISKGKDDDVRGADIWTLFMDKHGNTINSNKNGDKFLRDSILSLLFAGRDSTSTALSWLFYLLTKNPQVMNKIREELDAVIVRTKDNNDQKGQANSLSRNFKEVAEKLVYLHGAICEALRLYPPIAFEDRTAIAPDILPSGHKVHTNTQVVFDLYAMGRMKSIWGDDCYEFKPERWISETGNSRHEPSYKFLAFLTGPRTCLGKHMAFTQMKAVATTIIKNYDIQAVDGQLVVPDTSFVLRMKYGFKIKVLDRSI